MTTERFTVRTDPVRSAFLCDVGAPGIAATTAVGDDGAEYFIVGPQARGDIPDLDCVRVGHEQLGPLSDAWKQRVVRTPLRCGRPTKSGVRCRAHVQHSGDSCHHHRGAEQLQIGALR